MTTAAQVLARAAGEDGYVEYPSGSNRTKFGRWYGLDGEPWCAMFVSWVFFHEGLPLPASTSKGFAYTPAGAAWFQRQQRWAAAGTGQVMAPGDVVFYRMPNGPARINHVGIVVAGAGDGTFKAWEGNTDVRGGRTGGRVLLQRRSMAHVVGWGRPAFTAPPEAPPYAIGVPIPTNEEVTMRVPVRVNRLDDQGNGYIDLPFPVERFRGLRINAPDPAVHGFAVKLPREDGSLGIGGRTRVRLVGGTPGTAGGFDADAIFAEED